LIAELVGVSFVDGLGGEEEGACFDHGCCERDGCLLRWIKTNL
jgi:hypothetical protein